MERSRARGGTMAKSRGDKLECAVYDIYVEHCKEDNIDPVPFGEWSRKREEPRHLSLRGR
jgi:hypothetical protein